MLVASVLLVTQPQTLEQRSRQRYVRILAPARAETLKHGLLEQGRRQRCARTLTLTLTLARTPTPTLTLTHTRT